MTCHDATQTFCRWSDRPEPKHYAVTGRATFDAGVGRKKKLAVGKLFAQERLKAFLAQLIVQDDENGHPRRRALAKELIQSLF
jgi:hypothetical protein